MSWSIPTFTIEDSLDSKKVGTFPQPDYGYDESIIAMKIAEEAARYIIRSGALGEGPYQVTLNGHANPNNEPEDDWAEDYISVRISTPRKDK